jgi:hypothetical protein
LCRLIEKFQDPATPYISEPYGASKLAFRPYAHLSRVGEWGVMENLDEDNMMDDSEDSNASG